METLGQVLRGRLRDDGDDPLLRRRHLDGVLRADVQGRHLRQRPDQVPDQRAGRGQAQVADRRVPRVLRRRRRAAHRGGDARHRRHGRRAARARRRVPDDARDLLRRGARSASARSRRTSRTCAARASWSTATTRATCCRSSRSRSATARRCSSRSSSATARAASARATSRRCSRRSSASRSAGEPVMRYAPWGACPAKRHVAGPRGRQPARRGGARLRGLPRQRVDPLPPATRPAGCRTSASSRRSSSRSGCPRRTCTGSPTRATPVRGGDPVLGRQVLAVQRRRRDRHLPARPRGGVLLPRRRGRRGHLRPRGRGRRGDDLRRAALRPLRLHRDPARDDVPLPLRHAAALADLLHAGRDRDARTATATATASCSSTRRSPSATSTPPARAARRTARAGRTTSRCACAAATRTTCSTTTRSTSSAGTATSTRTRSTSPTSSPRPGRLHQPPPAHQTFQGPNFVICSFCPRMLDWDDEAIVLPVPPLQRAVRGGHVLRRRRLRRAQGRRRRDDHAAPVRASRTGRSRGTVEKAIGTKSTNELAVMCDTFRPLKLTSALARPRRALLRVLVVGVPGDGLSDFVWRDGERVIAFGRGAAAEAVELAGGPGFALLTTERALASAPALARGGGRRAPRRARDRAAAGRGGTRGAAAGRRALRGARRRPGGRRRQGGRGRARGGSPRARRARPRSRARS